MLLNVVIPLWLVEETDAPRVLLAWLFGTNTVMAVALQVAAARGVVSVADSLRAQRRGACFFVLSCGIVLVTHDTVGWVTIALVWLGHVTVTGAELFNSAGNWGLQAELSDPARRGEYQGVSQLGYTVGSVWAPAAYTPWPWSGVPRAGWSSRRSWSSRPSSSTRPPARPSATSSGRPSPRRDSPGFSTHRRRPGRQGPPGGASGYRPGMPARKDHGASIGDDEMYEALRDQGASKEKAARISNAAANSSRSKVGKKGGESGSYDDWTVEDLRKRASELEHRRPLADEQVRAGEALRNT